MKIIVAHPGRQHSFRLASALKKAGLLDKYITTVYDKENSTLMKFVKIFLSKENVSRAKNRKNLDLKDAEVIQYGEMLGLVGVLLSRYPKLKPVYSSWNVMVSDYFGRKVAKYAIKNNVDMVIMYDTNANKCFEILKNKAPDILRVMDISIANRAYLKAVYEKDFTICPQFESKTREEQGYLWKKKSFECLLNELTLTQYFIVPSKFVENSLTYSSVSDESIFRCAYGSNFAIKESPKHIDVTKHINAVYVGGMIQRKGIYYLLEAAMQLKDSNFHLTVVGAYDNSDGIFDKYMDHVTFTGRVLPKRVEELLNSSDIYIFPSLGEGMSLSVLEAMSSGLPCILTENSGVSELIDDGKNGFVIEIQSISQIVDKVQWFIDNKSNLSTMSEYSKKVASNYTWENYEKNIVDTVKKIYEKHKER